MIRRALIPACISLIAACGDGIPVEPPLAPPPPPPPTFVLFGIVQTVDGFPLSNALVRLFAAGGELVLDSMVTGASGTFEFGGVRGHVLLKVSRSGYFDESRSLNVTENLLSRFMLAPWPEADVLTLGEWIEGSVLEEEPPCDPVGWDAFAPCHRFLFAPSASGKLVITLEWSKYPELDATLVTKDGDYVGTSQRTGPYTALLEGPVLKDQSYEVRVSSYYGLQNFRLRAELIP